MTALHSVLRRVSLNTLWLFASRAIAQALSAVTIILLARRLGAEGLGQYAFATSIIFVANALTTYGTDTLIIREVARDAAAASRWLTASLIIQLTLSLITISVIWLVFDAPILRLYSLALIPLSFSTAYSAILRGFERMDAYMWFTSAVAASQLLGILLISTAAVDLTRVILVLITSQIMGAILAAAAARTTPELRFNPALIRRTLIEGLPLVTLMILSLLYQRLGIFALTLFADDASTGQFSAAIRIIEACKLLPAASLGALFPVLARREEQSVGRADMGLIAYAVAVALLLQFLSSFITPTLFGAEYLPAVPALRLLGWSLIPNVIAASLSLRLVASGHESRVLIAILITVLVSSVLYAILIAFYGLHGAAIAVIISEVLQAAILLILARSINAVPTLRR